MSPAVETAAIGAALNFLGSALLLGVVAAWRRVGRRCPFCGAPRVAPAGAAAPHGVEREHARPQPQGEPQ